MPERRIDDARLREVLRQAAPRGEPDVESLVEAVPAMLAEASRRRALAVTPAARLFAVGGRWFPRLAAATALLLLAALLWPATSVQEESTGTDEIAALDRWIVTGSSTESVSDPVLDALVR